MNKKNLIRIDNLDEEVYRIFPLHRIEEIFKSNKLVLVKPAIWDDPFENFLLRCTAVEEDGTEVGLDSIANSWYGLCWTLKPDSDAMWRIYSPNKDGIRVKTTIRKLVEAIWEPDNSLSSLRYFIGKVSYQSREEIENFLKTTSFWSIARGGQNTGFAETLLVKRNEFEHENEVRILTCSNDEKSDLRIDGGLYKIPIEPNKFIDEICIDPRLSDKDAATAINKIQTVGYTGNIIQSELYKLRVTKIKIA